MMWDSTIYIIIMGTYRLGSDIVIIYITRQFLFSLMVMHNTKLCFMGSVFSAHSKKKQRSMYIANAYCKIIYSHVPSKA